MADETKPVKEDKPLEIDLGGVKDETIFTNDEVTENIALSNRINTEIVQEQSVTPTYAPKTFREQFSMFSGDLYVSINNTWTRIANFIGEFIKSDGSTVYTSTGDGFKDEDTMASNSAVATASQQSIKKYIDAFKEKTEYTLEYRVVHNDTGEIRYVRDRGVPIFDEKGNISRFDGVVSDITESKEAEQTIRKSKEKYEEAYNRMIFYQNLIAHDVNNILNNVKAPAEMISHLQGINQDNENINDLINIIKNKASKVAILVKTVRKLSQLEESTRSIKKIEI